MEMSSVVPVAMAMLPVKVEQEARALASPAFWIVVVAETLQAADVLSANVDAMLSLAEHTVGAAGSGQGGKGDLHHGRHFV
jgi:hypothetical protein